MKPEIALVLGGGGARGAWQAGVLAWIAQAVAARTGQPATFPILVGTSVGAINAAFLAGEAGDFAGGAQRLWDHWSGTEVGAVYRLRLRRLWRVPRAMMQGGHPTRGPIALLDSAPLERIVRRRIRWEGVRSAVSTGQLRSVAFVTTELAGARATVFHHDTAGRPAPREGRRRFVAGPLGPEHVMASVALPLLFPPVSLGRRWYLDGGLSEQSPVGTAIGLGARRILSLGLQRPTGERSIDPAAPPTWPRVIGATMDSVLLGRGEPEVERMARVNRVLDWGEAAYGEGFVGDIAEAMADDPAGPWERTETRSLHPSLDLGVLAAQTLSRGLRGRVDDLTRVVFRFLEDTAGAGDADALSYLLFDPAYLTALLDLGWRDAEAQGNDLVDFLAGAE